MSEPLHSGPRQSLYSVHANPIIPEEDIAVPLSQHGRKSRLRAAFHYNNLFFPHSTGLNPHLLQLTIFFK